MTECTQECCAINFIMLWLWIIFGSSFSNHFLPFVIYSETIFGQSHYLVVWQTKVTGIASHKTKILFIICAKKQWSPIFGHLLHIAMTRYCYGLLFGFAGAGAVTDSRLSFTLLLQIFMPLKSYLSTNVLFATSVLRSKQNCWLNGESSAILNGRNFNCHVC